MEEKQPEQSVSCPNKLPLTNELEAPQPAKPAHPNYLGKFRKLLHFRRFEDGTLGPTTGNYTKDENGCIRRVG